jgi:hypothetical protein
MSGSFPDGVVPPRRALLLEAVQRDGSVLEITRRALAAVRLAGALTARADAYVRGEMPRLVADYAAGVGRELLDSAPIPRTARVGPQELARLQAAIVQYVASFVRSNPNLFADEPPEQGGMDDPAEPFHMRMLYADSIRPRGAERFNDPLPAPYALGPDFGVGPGAYSAPGGLSTACGCDRPWFSQGPSGPAACLTRPSLTSRLVSARQAPKDSRTTPRLGGAQSEHQPPQAGVGYMEWGAGQRQVSAADAPGDPGRTAAEAEEEYLRSETAACFPRRREDTEIRDAIAQGHRDAIALEQRVALERRDAQDRELGGRLERRAGPRGPPPWQRAGGRGEVFTGEGLARGASEVDGVAGGWDVIAHLRHGSGMYESCDRLLR